MTSTGAQWNKCNKLGRNKTKTFLRSYFHGIDGIFVRAASFFDGEDEPVTPLPDFVQNFESAPTGLDPITARWQFVVQVQSVCLAFALHLLRFSYLYLFFILTSLFRQSVTEVDLKELQLKFKTLRDERTRLFNTKFLVQVFLFHIAKSCFLFLLFSFQTFECFSRNNLCLTILFQKEEVSKRPKKLLLLQQIFRVFLLRACAPRACVRVWFLSACNSICVCVCECVQMRARVWDRQKWEATWERGEREVSFCCFKHKCKLRYNSTHRHSVKQRTREK